MADNTLASNGKKRTPLPQPGILLYPALGNPELVSGDDAIHLLVCLVAEPKEMAGAAGKQIVADHLKFLTMEDAEAIKMRLLSESAFHPAFDPALVLSVTQENDLAGKETPVFKDDKKRFYGIFRKSIVDYFTQGTLHGYTDARLKKALPKNVYHVTLDAAKVRGWMRKHIPDPEVQDHCFLHWATKPEDARFREVEEEAVTNALRKVKIAGESKFVGPRVQAAHDAAVKAAGEEFAGPDGVLRLFDIFQWEFALNRPYSTLHPVFFYETDKCLNVGFISDLHVVSRLELLRRSDFQVVPGVDAKYSAPISDMISTTGRAVRDLMSQAGTPKSPDPEDGPVDIMVLGGDLIDFAMSSFPGAGPYPERMKADTVRGMVNVDKGGVPSRYDYGVDFMAIFDLVAQFYRVAKKPVVILAGNHDAYDKPFGISPRVIGGKYKLGNPGIPGDANLTVMEACLLYGDRYDLVVEGFNFVPEVMDCYYLAFSPVFSFTSKMGKMQWITLGWGDAEDMLWDGPGLIPGHLPNANEAVSAAELPLIQFGVDAAKKADSAKCIMFSHYTWACYSDPVLQDGTEQYFPWGDRRDVTDYNLGTCELNRQKVYEHLFNKGIHYTVSGHAHRSGIYTLEMLHYVSGRASVRGHRIDGFSQMKNHFDPPYMIVSDSAGPIPRENTHGDFHGLGSNRPSFTKLTFNGGGELVGVRRVQSSLEKSKPRLAVTMDYCEIDVNGAVQWSDKFWLKEVNAKEGLTLAAVAEIKRNKGAYIPIHIPKTELEFVPGWVGIVSMALHLPDLGPGFTVFPIEYVSGTGWGLKDDKKHLLNRIKPLVATTLLTIQLGTYPEKAKGSGADRFDISKPWTVVVDFEYSPATPGTFYDDDLKISIKRNWDYVKYATQKKYSNLLRSVSAASQGAGSSQTSAPKTPAANPKTAAGKDGNVANTPDPGFQLKIPLPF